MGRRTQLAEAKYISRYWHTSKPNGQRQFCWRMSRGWSQPAIALCSNTFLDKLESFRYRCTWKVIDAADCGLPHHRERVFIVAIRRDRDCCTGPFEWPDTLSPMHLASIWDKRTTSENQLLRLGAADQSRLRALRRGLDGVNITQQKTWKLRTSKWRRQD